VNWTAVGPGGQPPDIYGLFAPPVNNPQGAQNFSFVADPTLANFIYVGGDAKLPFPFTGNIARGDSNTNTWTAVTRLSTAPGSPGTVNPVAGANAATSAPHSD